MEENFIKIINKTYKLIDFFPEGDPLKNKTKDRVLSILENFTLISGAQGWASIQKERTSLQVLSDIEILENYLKLAKYQGWIDNINFLILTREYHVMKSKIQLPKEAVKNRLETILGSENSVKLLVSKKELSSDSTAENYSERQRKILKMLHEKGKIQVSDIVKEIPNITKRTVRRDLDDLLKRGEIIRSGEWNKIFYKTRT